MIEKSSKINSLLLVWEEKFRPMTKKASTEKSFLLGSTSHIANNIIW
jgi:hypothetical protein